MKGGIYAPEWVNSRQVWKASCTMCDWGVETTTQPECERQTQFHEDGYRHRRRLRRST